MSISAEVKADDVNDNETDKDKEIRLRKRRSDSGDDKSLNGSNGHGKAKAAAEEYHYDRRERKLDPGVEHFNVRQRWYQFWKPKHAPPPGPKTLAEASTIPLVNASYLSILTFSWISPLMYLGYARTLQATDLYALDQSRCAGHLSSELEKAWERRVSSAKQYNSQLNSGEVKPGIYRRAVWRAKRAMLRVRRLKDKWMEDDEWERMKRDEQEMEWRSGKRKRASLAWALNDVLGHRFWSGGYYKVFGDVAQLMAPLVIRAIVEYAGKKYAAHHPQPGQPPTRAPSVVGGVFMAVALLIMSLIQNIGQQHFFWRSMTTGILARAALIASIYKRSLHLTPRSRKEFDNSKLLHFVSGDVSRIDAASQWFHAAWTAPIQIIICLIILLIQLGPTALIGFSLFLILIPFQETLMSWQFKIRKTTSEWSDKRMALVSECLSGMKVVKWFCYENRFLERIAHLRENELKGVWKIETYGSTNLAVAFSIPVIASVISFITYLFMDNEFNVAVIFSSLALFNLLRQPLMFLPRAMSGIADARSAFKRLTPLFEAELNEEKELPTFEMESVAIDVQGASFEWEESMEEREEKQRRESEMKEGEKTKKKKVEKEKEKGVQVIDEKEKLKEKDAEKKPHQPPPPFALKDVTMTIPKGKVVAVVGPVGSGKSSLLQGLVGEMRRTAGEVKFGGRVAYCPQVAWIQNTTLRENVLFGAPFEEAKYWHAMDSACLLPDLEVLPEADLTEIGERGINLSGGQKQRVNIARALYCDADIIIMDDPLSAVDAHVGKVLFHEAIMGYLRGQGKTVLLVTHALHFVSDVDYIYTIKDGRIDDQGTYADLMAKKGVFYKLLSEHGGAKKKSLEGEDDLEVVEVEGEEGKPVAKQSGVTGVYVRTEKEEEEKELEGMMRKEKRTTGSLSWSVYINYVRSGKGWITAPMIILFGVLMQCSQILNSFFLVWWEADSFHLSPTAYALIYAALGITQAIFTFLLGMSVATMARFSSYTLHDTAIKRVFHAPTAFFDTTPMGRLLSVFGKDFDSVDNHLTQSIRNYLLVVFIGASALTVVSIMEHYFLIAAFLVIVTYMYSSGFYTSSAREVKRLDSMLRSWLYSHFSESLTGIPTIKAYGAVDTFQSDNEYYIDIENRALFLAVTNQRWLATRLGSLGSFLVFTIALLAVLGTSNISPAQIGLILTYAVQLSQLLIVVTRQSTEVEHYMNAVERVTEYCQGDIIEQEAPQEIPDKRPKDDWPPNGALSWQKVRMAYRRGLPDVLKGVTMDIRGGEKIGVVGRTGAGKTSLVVALFRITELNGGRILLDGVDISQIGLRDLRSKLSIIPQDPLLFSGTIRSNLDPFSLYDDAHLWDALCRACLVDPADYKDNRHSSITSFDLKGKTELIARDEKSTHTEIVEAEDPHAPSDSLGSRFSLETTIEAEGLNLSVGQRSLLSLARALVKDAPIVVLDEATASVDLETDAKIQHTIATEFEGRTMICIAHRLRTILGYDRILVMDAGTVAELDTPINLFDIPGGIFRGMCDRSNITRSDIEKARELS